MAEFIDVCKQAVRMLREICKAQGGKPKYIELRIFPDGGVEVSGGPGAEAGSATAEAFEKSVMQWAAAHPELRYPSWDDAWNQLFPDRTDKEMPCPRYFLSVQRMEEYCHGVKCMDCRKRPILADIAEKLGIKPIGEDERGE